MFINGANRAFQLMLFDRLCITAPYTGGPIFQAWDEKIFRFNRSKGNNLRSLSPFLLIVVTVPIIVVYTKFDLFMASNQRKCKGIIGKGGSSLESADETHGALTGEDVLSLHFRGPRTQRIQYQTQSIRLVSTR